MHKIYRREEWNALRRSNVPANFERIMNWVLVGHSVTPLCSDLVKYNNRMAQTVIM